MVRGYVFADFPFLSPLATSMRGNPHDLLLFIHNPFWEGLPFLDAHNRNFTSLLVIFLICFLLHYISPYCVCLGGIKYDNLRWIQKVCSTP
nr:MAG TPA: hypothetical protein [Caudoviricetes sp.]